MTLTRSYTDALERALADVIANARREMATVFAEHRAEVAECKAQLATAKAEIAGLRDALTEHVDAKVARAVEALPKPEPVDLSGFVTREEAIHASQSLADDAAELAERVKTLEAKPAPEPVDLSPFATKDELLEASLELRSAIPVLPAPPDLSPFATREDVEALRREMPEVPEPKDWQPFIEYQAETFTTLVTQLEERTEKRLERIAERPGVFPIVNAWTDDGVTYAGHVVTHDGALWQARRDTGKAPGHDDWCCIVERGGQGANGRSIVHRGTYDPAGGYFALDAVTLNGSSFLAVEDHPGPCPGEGWQLVASRGSRGKDGDRGDRGERGLRGASPVAMAVHDDGLLTLKLEDGGELTADLYPLLAQVAK